MIAYENHCEIRIFGAHYDLHAEFPEKAFFLADVEGAKPIKILKLQKNSRNNPETVSE